MVDGVGDRSTLRGDRPAAPAPVDPTVRPDSATAADLRDVGDGDDEPLRRRGELLGRYVVIGSLGAGGMGVVYTAYDPELDRKLAVKLLRGRRHADDTSAARLLREAKAMARLTHPNVITVHDVGTLGDQVFVAMEYVAGPTLRVWQTLAPRGWRETLAVYLQAGRGLAAAHAVGLVHRDFKPESGLSSQVPENTSVSRLRRGYVPNLYQAGRPVKSPHANSAHSSARARSPHDRVIRVTPPAHPRHL